MIVCIYFDAYNRNPAGHPTAYSVYLHLPSISGDFSVHNLLASCTVVTGDRLNMECVIFLLKLEFFLLFFFTLCTFLLHLHIIPVQLFKVILKMRIFRDMAPYILGVDRRFRRAHCLHHYHHLIFILAAVRTWNLTYSNLFFLMIVSYLVAVHTWTVTLFGINDPK
jgi:hypothetical protein